MTIGGRQCVVSALVRGLTAFGGLGCLGLDRWYRVLSVLSGGDARDSGRVGGSD